MMGTNVDDMQHQVAKLEHLLEENCLALAAAQEALTNAEAKIMEVTRVYQTTFDLAAIGIAHITLDGKWLRINPFLCEMLGYSKEELQAKTFQELTCPEDLAPDLQLVNDLLTGIRTSYSIEKRYIKKSGEQVWGHLSVSLVRDARGLPSYFISIIKNIDARIRAQDRGEQSRARLKAILDSLSEGVIVFSNEGQLLEANPAAMRLFEYKSQDDIRSTTEVLATTFEVSTLDGDAISVEDWPISRLLRGEPVSNVELIVHRLDTGRSWIACISGALVSTPQLSGPLAVLTVEDVTKQLMAETALRVSEQRLRLAFDHIPDMIVIYDPDQRIQYVNLAAAHSIGVSDRDLIGQHARNAPPNSILALWRPLLMEALESAALQADDFDFTSDTGLRNLRVACVPITEGGHGVREIMVICHDYSERRQAEEKIRQAALHDPLTGLPNRALLYEYARHTFAAANRNDQEVSVLFIDLDRFKPINDIHGHEVGDMVLREVAGRLRRSMRGEDIVFRLGGDEFLALVPHHHEAASGEKVAQHLIEAISRPYHIGQVEAALSCSIGVSVYPRDGDDVDMLIGHADAAMYVAKQMGRKAIQFYTSSLAERVYMQSIIEEGIKTALKQDEFSLYYQPVVDMQTQHVVSVEALLRWPGNGMGPDRFIHVAEATGLIGRLGEWVFGQACEQHSAWIRGGLPAIPIAVNVSPVQFRKKNFASHLQEAIHAHCIASKGVQIELTETAVMEDIDHAITVLNELRSMGIKILLDDFGTGYSSLSYLSRLPLDKIKVDKSFVHRIQHDKASRAIIEAIIALGHTLNLEIVAEGIESDSTLQYLRYHGCHQAQGYHVCRPITGNQFAAWYREYTSLPH
ncbi:EAL domain-containing protein [Noviherbaspirillum sp. CPCC 100848]|uniref:EAL domain-containing protein n=1 Tax=Noviherbaspirillum album TaxID=3080276 RepID=A0ABU6JCA7_9BURK|nr:EAL domain-containing protein [Noviherbaspirillum sp. CPCC 100848]MEC4720794.1 EAL domain-containing protein [Noviherbaspirillum sp. CPCC 100848]